MAIVLKEKTSKGEDLTAIFLPEKGMNLLSFKKGDLEVIDQSTVSLFEERYAGLGALIGPHFHHRNAAVISPLKNPALFPHVERLQAKGIKEPFSHGIGRYAPWEAKTTGNKVVAKLTGKEMWNEETLANLEGQNFVMQLTAHLSPQGLNLSLSVVSDADSLVGIHYYYHLPEGKGKVLAHVKNHFREKGVLKPFHESIIEPFLKDHQMEFNLDSEADFTFYPFPDPLEGKISLLTDRYTLETTYRAPSNENCWQLYHPKGTSYVCIEPMSSHDPHHPNLTVSSIQIQLEIKT